MTGTKNIKKEDKNPKTPSEPQKRSKVRLMSRKELEMLKSHLEQNHQKCSRRYKHVVRQMHAGLTSRIVEQLKNKN